MVVPPVVGIAEEKAPGCSSVSTQRDRGSSMMPRMSATTEP